MSLVCAVSSDCQMLIVKVASFVKRQCCHSWSASATLCGPRYLLLGSECNLTVKCSPLFTWFSLCVPFQNCVSMMSSWCKYIFGGICAHCQMVTTLPSGSSAHLATMPPALLPRFRAPPASSPRLRPSIALSPCRHRSLLVQRLLHCRDCGRIALSPCRHRRLFVQRPLCYHSRSASATLCGSRCLLLGSDCNQAM